MTRKELWEECNRPVECDRNANEDARVVGLGMTNGELLRNLFPNLTFIEFRKGVSVMLNYGEIINKINKMGK